jgi:hypothetical protein
VTPTSEGGQWDGHKKKEMVAVPLKSSKRKALKGAVPPPPPSSILLPSSVGILNVDVLSAVQSKLCSCCEELTECVFEKRLKTAFLTDDASSPSVFGFEGDGGGAGADYGTASSDAKKMDRSIMEPDDLLLDGLVDFMETTPPSRRASVGNFIDLALPVPAEGGATF